MSREAGSPEAIREGQAMVVLRRLDALEEAIRRRSWEDVEFHYDNVRSAIERTIGTRLRDQQRPDQGSGDEFFTFGPYRWNVTKALEIVRGRERPDQVQTRQLATMLSLVQVDEDYAKTVDLERPLLLAMLPNTPRTSSIVIDGWHRIHRALTEGVPTLPAFTLSHAESERVRVK